MIQIHSPRLPTIQAFGSGTAFVQEDSGRDEFFDHTGSSDDRAVKRLGIGRALDRVRRGHG